MEILCNRCHQPVPAESCYCPACGLPQLVYSAEGAPALANQEIGAEPPRDASTVEWKTALRLALLMSIPAGLLCSGVSPLGIFGLFWMGAAAAWAVALYMRSLKPAWITLGAGARIGLVTGLLGGWLAFAISGGALFVERYVLHQSSQIDSEWKARVDVGQEFGKQLTAGMNQADAGQFDAQQAQFRALMLSPEGHAGMEAFGFACNAFFLLFFGLGGGALGARLMGRTRRPEV